MDPCIILHLDQLSSQELSVQRITRCRTILPRKLVVRPKSVLEDLYVSLPSLDRAVEQCHLKTNITKHACAYVQRQTGCFAPVVQQRAPSFKLHNQKAVEWSGLRAFKHEILSRPSFSVPKVHGVATVLLRNAFSNWRFCRFFFCKAPRGHK